MFKNQNHIYDKRTRKKMFIILLQMHNKLQSRFSKRYVLIWSDSYAIVSKLIESSYFISIDCLLRSNLYVPFKSIYVYNQLFSGFSCLRICDTYDDVWLNRLKHTLHSNGWNWREKNLINAKGEQQIVCLIYFFASMCL